MNRAVGFIVAAALAGSGCGDNFGPSPMTQSQLLQRLRALPGVSKVEQGSGEKNLSYYVLHFTQPLDHEDPSLGSFDQEVSLLHRNEQAPVPMIVHTSGYADIDRNAPVELTRLLDANQVSIEHRFYGGSRPTPTDWTKLTIKQAADDEHVIIEALKTLYGGAFLSTGVSKGGMTAVFHRRFWPDDVDGTVAYVAPISFGAPDPRYAKQFDKIGTDECRAAVRAVAAETLARRDQMELRAGDEEEEGHIYSRVKIGPAVEAAVSGLEWGFWQYATEESCAKVPRTTATDQELYEFLEDHSAVSEYCDEALGRYEPYYYQSYAELGYPDGYAEYLSGSLRYNDVDYLGELPGTEPSYDSEVMRSVAQWAEDFGERLLFVYGGWDPWFAGRFPVGSADQSKAFVKDDGNHDTKLASLDPLNRAPAFAMIKQWTGVEPMMSRVYRREGGTATDPTERRAPGLRLVGAPLARR
jgi:hypothetical protein